MGCWLLPLEQLIRTLGHKRSFDLIPLKMTGIRAKLSFYAMLFVSLALATWRAVNNFDNIFD